MSLQEPTQAAEQVGLSKLAVPLILWRLHDRHSPATQCAPYVHVVLLPRPVLFPLLLNLSPRPLSPLVERLLVCLRLRIDVLHQTRLFSTTTRLAHSSHHCIRDITFTRCAHLLTIRVGV